MSFSDSNTSSAVLNEDFEQIFSSQLPWSNLGDATVLIAGANGYIARYLIRFLLFLNDRKLAQPLRIIALVRNREKAMKHLVDCLNRNDFELLVQDVSEPIVFDGPIHYIIHAASQSLPKNYGIDPVGSIKPNVVGTWNLLELARRSQCRGFLFLSSGEVYGKLDSTDAEPVHEKLFGRLDPLDPRACYAESKRVAETMCQAWWHQFEVPAKIARLGHNYGPGMDLEDGRVFADFTANVIRREDIVLKSAGLDVRQFCYLGDTIAGLLTILLRGESGEAYNLVNVEAEIRIVDLAELLCGLFPDRGLRVIRPDQSENVSIPGLQINVEKIMKIGWRPRVKLDDGFKRTIISYGMASD